MKKLIAAVLAVMALFTCAFAEEENEMIPSFFLYVLPQQDFVIPDNAVSLEAVHYDGEDLQVKVRNTTDAAAIFSEYFQLYREDGGVYSVILPAYRQERSHAVHVLAAGGEKEYLFDISAYDLEPGKYRLLLSGLLTADFEMEGGWTE